MDMNQSIPSGIGTELSESKIIRLEELGDKTWKVGDWAWYTREDYNGEVETELMCIDGIGTNYIHLLGRSVGNSRNASKVHIRESAKKT